MTWYGRTFLRGGDEYGDGRGRLVMGKAVMEGPAMDRAEATVLWLNTLWLAPTALLTDPRVRWEPVDDVTARLVVPALPTDVASDGGAGDVAVLTLAFDPSTGALARVSTQRMDPALDAPRPYTAALDAYRPAGPLDVATEVRARWDDELAVELTLDGAVANPVPDTE
ncbi:MAG: hypothetical protein M5U14_14585 [Acidimicrobiia bacterium]|nr:hypothetical protein [Acidimicrobiia bacterium]